MTKILFILAAVAVIFLTAMMIDRETPGGTAAATRTPAPLWTAVPTQAIHHPEKKATATVILKPYTIATFTAAAIQTQQAPGPYPYPAPQ